MRADAGLRASRAETAVAEEDRAALEADLLAGFFRDPPTLPPRWFYDEKGSLLFDQITRLDEYYPTRSEAQILRARAAEIVGSSTTIVELGAGTCTKTRVLLDELADGSRYVPVDISVEVLQEAARSLGRDYPGLAVEPVIADLNALTAPLPGEPGRRLVLFLGGTIGNLDEAQRADFLRMLRAAVDPGDRLALGFDLVKDPQRLVAAYDDAAGVTAEFNLNMLDVVARTVDVQGLDRCDFRHEAVFNAGESRIEMWLRAVRDVRIGFPTLGRGRALAAGEGIRTEIARKFRPDELAADLGGHGFGGAVVWNDDDGDFGLLAVAAR